MTSPVPCMSDEEYAEWFEAARVFGAHIGSPPATLPCWDCTREFAAEQRAIGRCDRAPLGAESDDPSVEARRRQKRDYMRRVRARAA